MDFVEGLPKSEGHDAIMVVVDRLTKFAHFIPLRHPFNAARVARVFWDNVVKLHGIPNSIVSDRDRVFTSALWRELFTTAGTKLLYSTAYHPQTDGQSERVNQCMEMYLRCAIHDAPRRWRRWLPTAEFWYNSSFHSSINCTPFKALYGVEPNLGGMALWDDKIAPVLDSEHWDWGEHTARLRAQIPRAQRRFKKQADRNRTERSFEVGDSVLLKLQPYAQSTAVNRPCAKLAFKFYGPFKIIERIGKLAYKLELPVDSRIHDVFHVSQLKPYTPNYTPVFAELPEPPDLAASDIEPEEILERRMVKRGNHPIVQLRIRWSSFPTSTTWEDYDTLRLRFPASGIWQNAPAGQDTGQPEDGALLEDGALSEEEGHVTPASL